MTETATFTSVIYHEGDEALNLMTVGDHGQGERLVERIEEMGGVIIEITVKDVGDVLRLIELWSSSLLAPYRERVFGPDPESSGIIVTGS